MSWEALISRSLETCRDGVPSMNNGRVAGVRVSCELLLFSCRTRGHDFSFYSLPVDATVAWNFCYHEEAVTSFSCAD